MFGPLDIVRGLASAVFDLAYAFTSAAADDLWPAEHEAKPPDSESSFLGNGCAGDSILRSGGQTFQTGPAPRISTRRPSVTPNEHFREMITLLTNIRNLLQHNDRQHIVGSDLRPYECSIPICPRYTLPTK